MVKGSQYHATILSSIPGRVRLNIRELAQNEALGNKLIETYRHKIGILKVCLYHFTGNLLIIYKEERVSQADILSILEGLESFAEDLNYQQIDRGSMLRHLTAALNPFSSRKQRYSPILFEREYGLAKRIFRLGWLVNGITFAIRRMLYTIPSIAIFSNPGILFALSSAGYIYSARIAYGKEIYTRNPEMIGLFFKTRTILLDEGILFNKHFEGLNEINRNGIHLVNQLRENGINRIVVIADRKDEPARILGSKLYLEEVYTPREYQLMRSRKSSSEVVSAVVKDTQIGLFHDRELAALFICIAHDKSIPYRENHIHVVSKDFENLIEFVRSGLHMQEAIERSHVRAAALNTIMMLAAPLWIMNPFAALGLYGLNTWLQLHILRKEIYGDKGV